jgi:hypothetical protein
MKKYADCRQKNQKAIPRNTESLFGRRCQASQGRTRSVGHSLECKLCRDGAGDFSPNLPVHMRPLMKIEKGNSTLSVDTLRFLCCYFPVESWVLLS